MIGYVWGLAGESAKARKILREVLALVAERYIPPVNVAVVYLGLGDYDEALEWLEKAYRDRDVRLSFLKVDPKWDRVRTDPRFVSLVKRLGF